MAILNEQQSLNANLALEFYEALQKKGLKDEDAQHIIECNDCAFVVCRCITDRAEEARDGQERYQRHLELEKQKKRMVMKMGSIPTVIKQRKHTTNCAPEWWDKEGRKAEITQIRDWAVTIAIPSKIPSEEKKVTISKSRDNPFYNIYWYVTREKVKNYGGFEVELPLLCNIFYISCGYGFPMKSYLLINGIYQRYGKFLMIPFFSQDPCTFAFTEYDYRISIYLSNKIQNAIKQLIKGKKRRRKSRKITEDDRSYNLRNKIKNAIKRRI